MPGRLPSLLSIAKLFGAIFSGQFSQGGRRAFGAQSTQCYVRSEFDSLSNEGDKKAASSKRVAKWIFDFQGGASAGRRMTFGSATD